MAGRKKSAASEQLDAEKERGVGDNSADVLGGEAQKHIKSLSERIMRLLNDRDDVNADIKAVYAEVSDAGFSTKTLRKAIAQKRAIDKDPAGYKSEQDQIDLYFSAVHEVDLPMFEPILERAPEQVPESAPAE